MARTMWQMLSADTHSAEHWLASYACLLPPVNLPHFPQLSFKVVVRLNTGLSAR